MRLYIPSTSRSDCPNVAALSYAAAARGHEVVQRPRGARAAIILGDRSEMLTVARGCVEEYVPWVHVGAGCKTLGSWDQYVRDMLSAGAAAAWPYTRRNIDDTSWGVPVLDTLKPSGAPRRGDFVLVALNPVTAHDVGQEHLLARVIADACERLDVSVVWSTPNEDRQGAALLQTLDDIWPGRELKVPFRLALEQCRCIVGNSSAALIEAPALGTPYVDVGCRQKGRPLAQSLYSVEQIREGISFHEPHVGESPYRNQTRSACREIIQLAERIGE